MNVTRDAIEIIAEFDGSILDVQHVADGEYTIGQDDGASFVVEPGVVPAPHFALVSAGERGFELGFTRAMTGELGAGGEVLPLDAWVSRGLARASGAHHVVALPPGARGRIVCGNAVFTIARVPAPDRRVAPPRIDWAAELHTGATALVASIFIFAIFSLPPDGKSLYLDQTRTQAIAHFLLVPPKPEQKPVDGKDKSLDGGRASAAAPGPSGHIGKPTSQMFHATLQVKRVSSRDDARHVAAGQAMGAGILPFLESAQVGAIFRPDYKPLGLDKDTILGDLRGTQANDGYGTGLDLVGDGKKSGGGGSDEGNIGVGRLNSIGKCPTCTNDKGGYGSRPMLTNDKHVAHAPDIIPGKADVRCGVNGACLDKEIVRRVIHQHHAEVRFCYEKRLMMKDGLGGRVVTQFTIAGGGKVLSSVVTETSLHDRDVEECIVQALRRWEFPRSGQTSFVTYPFILQGAK
jgi:hypothetical protein